MFMNMIGTDVSSLCELDVLDRSWTQTVLTSRRGIDLEIKLLKVRRMSGLKLFRCSLPVDFERMGLAFVSAIKSDVTLRQT